VFTCVLIGGSSQNLQELLDFDSVLLIFGLESENKLVISLLLLHRFKSFESSFSLLLNFFLCDRAWVCHYQWWIRAWIVEETVQWWRFNAESLRITANFIEFAWILILEKLGFMHCSLFLWISGFLWILDRNRIERENSESVCEVALNLWLPPWLWQWPVFYRLPSVHWTNENVTSGLDCLRGIGLNLDLRTFLQNDKNKGLTCNKNKIGKNCDFENNVKWNN